MSALSVSIHSMIVIYKKETYRKEGKMKALFELCGGWENCDKSDDLRTLFEDKIIGREKFKLPEGDELEKYNEICRKCNYSLEIEESKCPVCGSENLQRSPLVLFHEKQPTPLPVTFIEGGGITQYLYRCENCKRLLYSLKKI